MREKVLMQVTLQMSGVCKIKGKSSCTEALSSADKIVSYVDTG